VAKVKDPKRVATGRRSRRKGAVNERVVAALLRAWWGRGEFLRTPSSGGWAGSKQAREDLNAAGDIVTSERDFPFCVEVKSQEGWSFVQFMREPGTCLIRRWWEQTTSETPNGKIPLLMFTRIRQPWFVMLPTPWRQSIHRLPGPWPSSRLWPWMDLQVPGNPPMLVTVLTWETFSKVPAEAWRTLLALTTQARTARAAMVD
jgi:hypothetical protein